MKGKRKITRKIGVILLVAMMMFGTFGSSVFAEELNPAEDINLVEDQTLSPDVEINSFGGPITKELTLTKRYEGKTPDTKAVIKIDGVVWNPQGSSNTYNKRLEVDKEYEISEIAPAGFCGVDSFKIKFVSLGHGRYDLISVGTLPAGVKITEGDHLEIYNTLSERTFDFEKDFELLNQEPTIKKPGIGLTSYPDFTIAYPDGTSNVYGSTDGSYQDVLLKVGANTITESNVPAGYEGIESFVINMNRNGDLSGTLPEGVDIRDGKCDTQIKVFNSLIERDVQLVKTYEGTPDRNAKFEVNGHRLDFENGVYDSVTFKYGINYTFAETRTPSGFVTVGSFVLTLDGFGKLISVGELPDGVSIDGYNVNVYNSYITKEINIFKVDEEDEALAGALFSINNNEMRLSEGGDRFSADINNVSQYTISEIAPVGYIGVADFTIKLNNNRTAIEAVGELPDGVTIEGLNIIVENTKMTNTLTIFKTDGKELLSGALFTVSDLEVVVDESGCEFSALVEHGVIYTIHESITPTGYTGVADFQVKLSDDGQSLVAVGTLPDDVILKGMTISVANDPITVITTRTDIPNTGDTMTLPIMMILFAASGLAGWYVINKKKNFEL